MAETKWEFDKTKVLKPTSAPRFWLNKQEEAPAPVVEAPVVEEAPKKTKKAKAEAPAEETTAEETKPE